MKIEGKQYEMRQLVEHYYDIQKLRVEAFNRIVSFLKEHKDEILSQIKGESQSSCASHSKSGAHQIFASQFKFIGAHPNDASPPYRETQKEAASQLLYEAHNFFASLLEKKRYAEAALLVCKGKFRIEELGELVWFHNKLLETEKEIYKRLDLWSREFEIRKRYLNHIKGIGPVLASGLIAWLYPIERFPKVSNLWSYCGLAPGQKRKRGEKLNYNPRLKTLCWKIWNSFIKANGKYREFYLKFKEDCKEKHPDWTKLHIHNYAGRKTVKLFLSHLWEVWRKLEGLPITEPYPIQILGHSTLIPPFTDKGGVQTWLIG